MPRRKVLSPVFFGHNYHNFKEAKDLIAKGGAFCFHDYKEFESGFMKLFKGANEYNTASELSKNYIKNNTGGTEKIMNYLNELL